MVSCDPGVPAGEIGLLAIDYVEFQKCTMGGSVWSWVILLLLLAVLFWLLGDTADTYFSPILSQICETVSLRARGLMLRDASPWTPCLARTLSLTRLAIIAPLCSLLPSRTLVAATTSSISRTASLASHSLRSAMARRTCSHP